MTDNNVEHQDQLIGRYVQMDAQEWVPFPEALCDGPITWKLLNVSPEMGAWTAIFDCPEGSSFNAHIHIGPGEYFLTKGKMSVGVVMIVEERPLLHLVTVMSPVMQGMTKRIFMKTVNFI